jgi:multidrug efflux pump subunit AcrB
MIKSIIRTILKNPVLANILMLLILISGYIASFTMMREIFPNFSLGVISVSVAYPGADAKEIEEGICLRLEDALDGVEGVKDITFTAKEGNGSAIIECTNNADLSKVKDEVESRVDAISTFPEDSEKPVVTEVKLRSEVLSVAVWGKLPEHQLKEMAQSVKDRLLSVNGITQVDISGIRDYEISVEIPEENLRKYKLTFDDIAKSIQSSSLNLPLGSITSNFEEIGIRAIGRRYVGKDYGDIPVITKSDGTVIFLGDIANIKDTYDEDEESIVLFNGEPAVVINIFKTQSEDSIKIAAKVNGLIKKISKELPPTVHLTKFKDFSRLINGRLDMLMRNGIIGLILVIGILWMFLDLRLSFWVAMGIPISIAGGLAIMAMGGSSINMLTMFGLIMVLGLIVDDAIVVGESIYTRRQAGDSAADAAVNGTAEVALPVIAAVLTTIVAFIPLFFVPGVIGKFIRQIPIPVVAALSVSLVEGLFILPVHLSHLPRKEKKPNKIYTKISYSIRSNVMRVLNYFIDYIYGPFMDRIFSYRYVVVCIAICVLFIVAGLFSGGIIKYVFMPESDEDFIRAKIEFPPGTPLSFTRSVSKKIITAWDNVDKNYYKKYEKKLTVANLTMVGSGTGWKAARGQDNVLEVVIEMLPSEDRNLYYVKLVQEWKKEAGAIPGAVSTKFDAFHKGPGGYPIEIKLFGSNQQNLTKASWAIVDKLNTINGVYDAQSDYRSGIKEYIIRIKPNAYHLGITLNDIAKHVHGGFNGSDVIRIQRERDDVKVKVRYPGKLKDSIEYLKKLRVKTVFGEEVPFMSIASVEVQEGLKTINRKNHKQVVDVTAEVDDSKANSKEILNMINESFLPDIAAKYNVTYKFEGETKETNQSMSSLLIGFPLAMFVVYFIIASIFKSYIQPLVIMTVIPFGLIGAIIGHFIFGMAVTIMSIFGMVALSGIVVNDAIVLIEGINLRLESGMSFHEALREGGKRRFRAILLTTLTTFFGLMPIILEKSIQAQVIIPMAISIAFGVLFATVITLIFIPCLLAVLNDIRKYTYYLWFLKMPTCEEVEPRHKLNINKK